MSGAPSPLQSAAALNRANEIRFKRGAIKRELKSLPRPEAMAMLADVLEQPPPCCVNATPFELLCAVRLVGRYYALSWLRRAGVPEHRRISELTERQRGVLADLLRAGEGQGVAA